jgi:hypothetical protein
MTTANLGPLAAFTGTYGGVNTSSGINTIYVPSKSGPVLKIARIREELKFLSSPGLFGVPVNRGGTEDTTLTPIIYDQYLADNDIPETMGNLSSGAGVIHQEVGMWILAPATEDPSVPASVQRLGSIPHGVSFTAQGFISTVNGPPVIPPMNTADAATPNGIRPFVTGQPDKPIPTPAASAADAAKVSQAVLDDPNQLLRNVIAKQKISATTIISVDTQPTDKLAGGGLGQTAFLLGNAECLRLRSTFYIETLSGWFGPQTQIQYTQEVLLAFGGVTYPHITVATLTRDPMPTPIVL